MRQQLEETSQLRQLIQDQNAKLERANENVIALSRALQEIRDSQPQQQVPPRILVLQSAEFQKKKKKKKLGKYCSMHYIHSNKIEKKKKKRGDDWAHAYLDIGEGRFALSGASSVCESQTEEAPERAKRLSPISHLCLIFYKFFPLLNLLGYWHEWTLLEVVGKPTLHKVKWVVP